MPRPAGAGGRGGARGRAARAFSRAVRRPDGGRRRLRRRENDKAKVRTVEKRKGETPFGGALTASGAAEVSARLGPGWIEGSRHPQHQAATRLLRRRNSGWGLGCAWGQAHTLGLLRAAACCSACRLALALASSFVGDMACPWACAVAAPLGLASE